MQFKHNMRIEFGKSRSIYFKEALSVAKRINTFEEKQINGVTIYSVGFAPYSFENFIELARLVWGWKTTRIILGARLLRHIDFFRLSQVFDCYARRQEFENKRLYCFVGDDYYGSDQLFPCKFIRLSLYDLIQDDRYGEITSDGSIYFNKERIIFEIERQLRLAFANYCPNLDYKTLQAIVERIPDMMSAKDRDTTQRSRYTIADFCYRIELPQNIIDENIRKFNGVGNLERLLKDIDLDEDKKKGGDICLK